MCFDCEKYHQITLFMLMNSFPLNARYICFLGCGGVGEEPEAKILL